MLYLAGSTQNHIPKNPTFIKNKINYHHDDDCLLADIERIKGIFPNGFTEADDYYYFTNFETLHNYIGKSKGNPKEFQRIVLEKNKSKSRVREEAQPSAALTAALDKIFKKGFNIYQLINRLKKESKVGARVPDEVLLRVCESWEKNACGVKADWPWFAKAVAGEWEAYNVRKNIQESKEWKSKPAISIKDILNKP
jgi:hypothetical protein